MCSCTNLMIFSLNQVVWKKWWDKADLRPPSLIFFQTLLAKTSIASLSGGPPLAVYQMVSYCCEKGPLWIIRPFPSFASTSFWGNPDLISQGCALLLNCVITIWGYMDCGSMHQDASHSEWAWFPLVAISAIQVLHIARKSVLYKLYPVLRIWHLSVFSVHARKCIEIARAL